MTPRRGDVVSKTVVTLLVSTMLLSGCGTIMPRYLGIRPDPVDIKPSEDKKKYCEDRHAAAMPQATKGSLIAACREFEGYAEWANQLIESYKTRATMNEWAIYVAGTVALGALGAISGLGIAAAAATETIALIGVSSGFTAGFFGMLNNSERAGLYAAAVTQLTDAVSFGRRKVFVAPTDPATYGEAALLVSEAVRSASNSVETGRYRLAAAAAAQEQQKAKEDVAEFQRLAVEGAMVDVQPCPPTGGVVDILVSGVNVEKYRERIKVFIDSKPTSFDLASSVSGKIAQAKFPPMAPGQQTASVRVQVGPVSLQGERQCRLQ